MLTAALSLSFTSDLEGGVAGITGPGTQLIAEAAGGNAVVANNAGFVDANGTVVKADRFQWYRNYQREYLIRP
jgi:hypothetical protein